MKRKITEIDLTDELLPIFLNIKNYEEDISEDFFNLPLHNINDLIHLADITPDINNKKIKILKNLKESLQNLNKMIGLDTIKDQIFEQVLYYLFTNEQRDEMLHTVIHGPPGSGKSELALIIADIYKNLDVISGNHIISAKRSELIGSHLGETSIKTQNILNKAKGGILFIDEAYSLGNSEGKDSYSKECINAITSFLTEEKNNFILIIAGYEEDLNKCFFKYNEGLKRRFNWIYNIDEYKSLHFAEIFKKKIKQNDWNFEDNDDFLKDFFEKNKDKFKFNGGDIENFFFKCKLSYIVRIKKNNSKDNKIITTNDIINTFNKYFNIEDKNFKNYSMYI